MTAKNTDELSLYVSNYKKVHGIYRITNKLNDKFYVGSAVNLYERWHKHKSQLLKNKHDNGYLQKSFNKHGLENFNFEVIEIVDSRENLINREQYWIDILDATNKKIAYNLAPNAGSMLGFKHTEKTKAKISKNRKGIKIPQEAMDRSAQNRRGLKISEERKRKISEVHKGKAVSEETRTKLSKALKGRKGEPRSEETKMKISKANKGRTTMPKGENVANATITDEQAKQIKLDLFNGASTVELSEKYNIKSHVISDIRRNKSFKHILPELVLSKKNLTSEDVMEIKKLLKQGTMKQKEIAKKFSVSTGAIKNIKSGKSHKDI